MDDEKLLIWQIKHLNSNSSKEKIISRYYDEIYRYIYRHTMNIDDALDLTQEVFIKALNSISHYESQKASFRTWLYKIASNKMIDWYRSRRFTEELSIDIALDSNFEEAVENKLQVSYILNCLEKYDPISREIFELKFFADLTFADIGSMMSLTESTVKSKYYRSINRFRKEFNGNGN